MSLGEEESKEADGAIISNELVGTTTVKSSTNYKKRPRITTEPSITLEAEQQYRSLTAVAIGPFRFGCWTCDKG